MPKPIPSYDDAELLERYQALIALRMKDLQRCKVQLAREAQRLSRKSAYFTISIVVLGAVVALRGTVEQLMVKAGAPLYLQMAPEVVFTFIGLAIAVTAGLDSAFKFGQRAIGLSELSGRCSALTMTYMSVADNPKTNADELWSAVEKLNRDLGGVYKDANKFRVDLTLGSAIDFSELLGRRNQLA